MPICNCLGISLLRIFGFLLISISLAQGYQQNPNLAIQNVHVLFANHLDVGFDGITPTIGSAINVINKYFTQYFPAVVTIANQIRSIPGLRYIYTSHAWLVSLYLDCANVTNFPGTLTCPNQTDIQQFEAAIARGDITWHAFPFNAQLSLMDADSIEMAVSAVHLLDAKYKQQPKKTLSQRDVPGITLGAIDALNKAGVDAVSVGVNGGSAPPAVPKVFLWKNPQTAAQVIAMWHPGGYGDINPSDCVTFPGFSEALAFAWRGDNAGPGDYKYVLGVFAQITKEFPNAKVFASTFDDFVAKVQTISSQLPVITSEIGDNWINGVSSDPWKVQMWREILRVLSNYKQNTNMYKSQPPAGLAEFQRLIVKAAEHTWGLDVKTFLHDTGNWSNADFQKWRKEPNFVLLETSWDEQRQYIYNAIKALGTDPLAQQINNALNALRVTSTPNLSGYKQVQNWNTSDVFSCGDWSFNFGESGGLTYLEDNKAKKVWATQGYTLGQYVYTTFDSQDYDKFWAGYCYCSPGNCPGWLHLDLGKPNVQVAKPVSGQFVAKATALYVHEDPLTCSYYLQSVPPADLHINYGAPSTIWTQTNFTKTGPSTNNISMDFFILNKTPTRLPEAHWIEFHPVNQGQGTWWVDKCGQMIDSKNVVVNGSTHIHGQINGVHFKNSQSEIRVEALDISLVSLGTPSPFPTPMDVVGKPEDGIFYNFFNNIWGTNYVMWYPWREEDSNALYRFRLTLT